MDRGYFNRYEYFEQNGEFKIVPGIELPIKTTDKYYQYKRGKDRLDKLSQEYYDSPVFGWLIMMANPSCGTNEFEIPDNYILRIHCSLKFPSKLFAESSRLQASLYAFLSCLDHSSFGIPSNKAITISNNSTSSLINPCRL